MKVCLALAVLALGLVVVPSVDAWWGWGGLGLYSPYSYGWGFPYYRYYRDTMSKGDISGRVSCKYIKERSFLSCGTQTGSVECGVVGNFTGLGKTNFELYGIGKFPTVETTVENIRFPLFPRSLDNAQWWNSTYVVEAGKTVELALFHTYSDKYYGYRVTDFKCFERFVNLFKTVEPVNYENIVVVAKEGPTRNCSLIGEILVDVPVRV